MGGGFCEMRKIASRKYQDCSKAYEMVASSAAVLWSGVSPAATVFGDLEARGGNKGWCPFEIPSLHMYLRPPRISSSRVLTGTPKKLR